MPYDNLREAYIEARTYLTKIIEYSEKLGLEDNRISYLLSKEGFLGENIFRMLSDIRSIQRGDSGFLVTPKSLGLDKDRALHSLLFLKVDAEAMEEKLELINGEVDKEIMETVRKFCHSLNKLDDIVTDLTLEKISPKETE